MKEDIKYDLATFNASAAVVRMIADLQRILKNNLTKVEARGTQYPYLLNIKWIPEGIEVNMAFNNGSMFAQVYQPENLEDYPVEYQERVAECDAAVKKTIALLRGDKEE